MFYTLGDYRDLCVGNTPNGIDTVSGKETDMQKIKKAIDTAFNSGSEKNPSPSPPGEKTTRESWWKQHAESIWNGMICALTYKESDTTGEKGKTTITQDESLKSALLESGKNTPKSQYQYKTVKLEEEASGAKTSGDTQLPTLKEFVSRPTYFRYLEEWGETFCKERKKRLEEVKNNCRNSERNGHHYCSGDGHDCTENGNLKHKDISADLYCPDCYEQCRKYRKWIDRKFQEFHNQKNKYGEEKQKLKDNSKNDGDTKKFCTEIKEKTSAADFLKSLRHCKDGQTGGEKKSNDQDNKINFNDPKTTFGPLDYCKTCPPNKVNCNGGSRRSGGNDQCTAVNGNGETWEKVFEGISGNGGKSSTIEVEMIDRRGPFIDKNSEKSFKDSYLFKGLRNQKWECKVINNDTDVCKLTNFDETIDLNQYTTFKVFLVYWLEDFIESYYILKKRKIVEKCTQKGEKACSEEPKNDCACVKVWLEKKKKEWGDIKNHFKKRKQEGDANDMKSSVKQLLDPLIYRMDLVNDKGKITKLSKFDNSCGCSTSASSEKSKEDPIECLLDKLGEKAEKCKDQASGETEKSCVDYPPLPDDDESLEETEENQVEAPNICPKVDTTKEEETDDKCEEASPQPAQPAESEQKPEEAAPSPEELPSPPSIPRDKKKEEKPEPPKIVGKNLFNNPAVIPSLVTSTLAWSVGI
ncbi:hypothetical protein PFTANZ_06169, partial [Plasmodium falciparum Tanzania (2000708)]